MDKKYGLDRALLDFSLEEMAHGTLRMLEECPQVEVEEIKDEEKGLSYIKLSEDVSGGKSYVIISNPKGELISASCNCKEFSEDYFSCKHITSMLAWYFQERDGVEALKKPVLFHRMQELAEVADPFLPGILRKTDGRILSLTKRKRVASQEKPKWVTDPKDEQLNLITQMDSNGTMKNGNDKVKKSGTKGKSVRKPASMPISLECELTGYSNGMIVEIRVGEKRHFVIHDFCKLLKAYRSGATFSFSKSLVTPAGRASYEPADQPIMDFLAEMVEDARRRNSQCDLFVNGYREEKRYFILRGQDLDAFMALLDGRTVKVKEDDFDEAKDCLVWLEENPTPLEIKKENYGATLSIPATCVLASGRKYLYMLEGNHLLRRDASEWEQRRTLSVISEGKPELYVRQKDLPALCANLKQLLSEEGQLICQDMELQAYIPETPKIRIYLDYPQEGLISCKVEAFYQKQDKAYPVYNQNKNKKKRDLEAEQPAGEMVWEYFDAYDKDENKLYLECDSDGLYSFLTETIPALSEAGEIFISDALKRLKVRPAGPVNVGIQLESGKLMMSLKSADMSRQEMAELLSAYKGKKKYTRLKNGSFITVDPEQSATWETLADLYQSYGRKNPEAMQLPMFRALYLEEMLGKREEVILQEGDSYAELIRNMKTGYSQEEVMQAIPKSLQEIMRPYQKEGFSWLKLLKENGFGGVLADDMGLGKTLQVVAFLLSEKLSGKRGDQLRTLVVAPASLVYNWKREIATFTPELTCQVIAGTAKERTQMIKNISRKASAGELSDQTIDVGKSTEKTSGQDLGGEEFDVYITSYDLLKRDIAAYSEVTFANEIVDEAQFIKNQHTQAAKGVRLVDAGFRMALTGTPVENRLSEMWSIFDYLMPGFLHGYSRFRTEFEAPVVQHQDAAVMEHLRKLIHPFILRRLKKDVLTELPDKLEEVVTVRLEGQQRKLYDARASRLRLYLDKQSDDEFRQSKLEILAELTKLRQLCCGPELFLENYHGENAKLEACMELVRQAVDSGHKVLLFSQFTTVLDELGQSLEKAGLAYHRIDGSVSKEKRMQMVESFEKDEVPVFCISLKAGGTGLNLTAADIVIHYDPWWNVAAQNQATDRAHRIGQANTVTVYKLIAEDTLEEQIVKLQQSKAKLAENLLSGEGVSSVIFNKEDLLGLL